MKHKLYNLLFYLLGILFLVIIYFQTGLKIFLIFFFSLFVHEVSHVLFAKIFNVNITDFKILPLGAKLTYDVSNTSLIKQALVYLSGPLSNLLFAILIIISQYYIVIPNSDFFIFYNILIALLNLIPSFPLDLSRAIYALLRIRCSDNDAFKIIYNISLITDMIIILLGLYVLFTGVRNIVLIMLGVFLFCSVKSEKDKYLYSVVKKCI